MTRGLTFIAIALALAGCRGEHATAIPTGLPDAAPPHPGGRAPRTVRTGIGEVRAIDAEAGTITVALVSGAARERSGLGPMERLRTRRELQTQVRIGEVIEFRFRAGPAMPEVIALNRHIHREPVGLPGDGASLDAR
jgi:hypothetical protein